MLDFVVWESGDGTRYPYEAWDENAKQRLEDIFSKLVRGERELGLACPADLTVVRLGRYPYQWSLLTREQAFDVYAAHVAHALYVETQRLVPWSLKDLSRGELEELFVSSNYHSRIRATEYDSSLPTHIRAGRDFELTYRSRSADDAMVCDPRVGYRFVTGRSGEHPYQDLNLLASTQKDTLVNLTSWVQKRVVHGSATNPVTRPNFLLVDRLRTGGSRNSAHDHMIIAQSGCHSAAQMLYDLAKSVNIPLLHVGALDLPPEIDRRRYDPIRPGVPPSLADAFRQSAHSGLVFHWDRDQPRVLWHADVVYAENHSRPVFPIGPDGTLLGHEAAKARFFDAWWVSPSELRSAGFVYSIERVQQDETAGPVEIGGSGPRSDYGPSIGYWNASDRHMAAFARGESDVRRPHLSDLFAFSRAYDLCSWRFVSEYDPTLSNLSNWVFNLQQARNTSVNPNPTLPLAEYGNRAQVCIRPFGTLDSMREEAARQQAEWGYPPP